MNCSMEYQDNFLQYQICPHVYDKCDGDKSIDLWEGYSVKKEIRNMSRGETCNFRVRSECGAPVFTVPYKSKWSD